MSDLLFHWSPRARRAGILREGLCPGKLSMVRWQDGLVVKHESWRPPFICFAWDPEHAWMLSGSYRSEKLWDLWMIRPDEIEYLDGYEILRSDDETIDEVRIYQRIYKRDVRYVASRGGTR